RKDVEENDKFFYQFFRDGSVLQLRRIAGYCKFMKDGHGCVIFNHRPCICRLFPFSFEVKKNKTIRILIPKAERIKDEHCSILYDNFYRSNGACFKAMNTSREKLMALVELHVKELEKYGKYVDDIAAGMPLAEVVEKYKLGV
ncbi:MAG: YkgJ family cysteine cluster protein, partial [Bacteroidetes bacterium]|nr:YkgJ family cysteine cluster protein [Bacteroidota bacterium]